MGRYATMAIMLTAISAVAATAAGPRAGAQPSLQRTEHDAAAVIAELEDQGYRVTINWLNGYDVKPLDRCWVVSVNNPGDSQPTPDTFPNVYVDVRCPNNDDDGFTGGIGIGLG